MEIFSSVQLIWVVFGLLFLNCESFSPNEVYALTTFKEAIYDDPYMVMSDWNALDADPCGWFGITCSETRDIVVKINISGSSLKGFLAPELRLLSSLEELILHANKLIGIIPKEIGSLRNLKILDLGVNQLSGPIPQTIGNLVSIVKINLQSNALSGSLPPEIGNLHHLEELRVDHNKLRGTVLAGGSSDSMSNILDMYASGVGICCLTQLKVVDFSLNFFTGSIPQCLDKVPRSSFKGNCLQVRDIPQRSAAHCDGAPPAKNHSGANSKHQPIADGSKHQRQSKPAWLLALEIVTGTMVAALFLVASLTAFQRCKTKPSLINPGKKCRSQRDNLSVHIDSKILKDVMKYSRQELEVVCEDFSNIIGSSPDSFVYKGNMKGGPEIAVIAIAIKEEHWTGYLELYFQREVADLARLNHENIGKLLGYCRESTPFTRMLVFEYASNGTLYEHLHYEEGCQLSWTRRMKISIGIACGLKYLHNELDPPFTISELNSNAVYLTDDFSPKLVDFESWKTILARSEKNSDSIRNQGAICILPNSLEKRHLDVQGNIYAFGVLLLEIISGKLSFCKEEGYLVDWAKTYLERPEEITKLVDPAMKHFKDDELLVVCEVVNRCINPDFTKRPSIEEIFTILERKIDTSVSAEFKSSPFALAWAELALSS